MKRGVIFKVMGDDPVDEVTWAGSSVEITV